LIKGDKRLQKVTVLKIFGGFAGDVRGDLWGMNEMAKNHFRTRFFKSVRETARAQALRVRYAQALRAMGSQSFFFHYESEIKYLNKTFLNTDFGFILKI